MNKGQTRLAEVAEQLTNAGELAMLYVGPHKFAVKEAKHLPETGVLACRSFDDRPLTIDVGALVAVVLQKD